MNRWKWVPVEPTDVMVERICAAHAGGRWPDDYGLTAQRIRREHARGGYASMLAAAPTPPAEAVTCSNAALQAFQRFADYDAKTDCYVVQADDLRPAIDAALAAKEQP